MTMMNTLRAVDSLCANEFSVEINGEAVNGVFRISGFSTFKLDSTGGRVKAPFEIAKMVQRDGTSPLNRWLRETAASRHADAHPTRELVLKAIDDGTEIRRWTVKGAWIQEVRYSDFNSASFEMIEEIFVIAYDDIEEGWPASPA